MLWQLICFLEIQIPLGKTNRRYTHKIFWLKILKNKRPKVENFDHFDHVSCDKCVRDWNLSRGGVLMATYEKVSPCDWKNPLLCFRPYSIIQSFQMWVLQVNKAEGLFNAQPPLPPVPSVSTIPEESDFLYCSISCWRKRTLYTSRLALCLVSGVSWRTDFLRCSGTSGPCNRKCMSCCCFFFFVIFLNSFPMSASERATSPPLFEPEEGNSEASEERDVF